ncbi:DUF3325 domain-containing protein [Granulibacter bethesdensis]|uniref:DUF3325 domain-containing protein n=1 Tax=Granulibacter bethesdensis TaxID=364410 RepID=UPI00093306C3|nr:DUF3325 domain-containing protein [Granulibacter bethesdensis]
MMPSLALLAAFLITFAAFTAIAWSMERHKRQMAPSIPLKKKERPDWRDQIGRLAGWIGLVVALILCATGFGWAAGPVAWFGVLTLAAITLALILAYRPVATRQAAGMASLLAALLCAASLLS